MRTTIKYFVLTILLLNSVIACTPTDRDSQPNSSGVYATGDDSSVRPDNDKDG